MKFQQIQIFKLIKAIPCNVCIFLQTFITLERSDRTIASPTVLVFFYCLQFTRAFSLSSQQLLKFYFLCC